MNKTFFKFLIFFPAFITSYYNYKTSSYLSNYFLQNNESRELIKKNIGFIHQYKILINASLILGITFTSIISYFMYSSLNKPSLIQKLHTKNTDLSFEDIHSKLKLGLVTHIIITLGLTYILYKYNQTQTYIEDDLSTLYYVI